MGISIEQELAYLTYLVSGQRGTFNATLLKGKALRNYCVARQRDDGAPPTKKFVGSGGNAKLLLDRSAGNDHGEKTKR